MQKKIQYHEVGFVIDGLPWSQVETQGSSAVGEEMQLGGLGLVLKVNEGD